MPPSNSHLQSPTTKTIELTIVGLESRVYAKAESLWKMRDKKKNGGEIYFMLKTSAACCAKALEDKIQTSERKRMKNSLHPHL
jgi:hypothetical protein